MQTSKNSDNYFFQPYYDYELVTVYEEITELPSSYSESLPASPPASISQSLPEDSYASSGLLEKTTNNKAALLIGINYRGQSSALSGCINDVLNVKKWLLEQGYQDIVMLHDNMRDKKLIPTKKNMLDAIDCFVNKAISEGKTELWFHYSGHGSQVRDYNGDEQDGYDETLVPVDYQRNGQITDDVLLERLVKRLPKHVKLTAFMDCCHSGTQLDLPYNLVDNESKQVKNIDTSNMAKVLMVSGCRDDQTSADAYDINNSKKWAGAMTAFFLETMRTSPSNINCKDFLQRLRQELKQHGYSQYPQLSTTWCLDPYSPLL